MNAKQLIYAISEGNDEYIEKMEQPITSKKSYHLTILLVATILISLLGLRVYAAENILPTDYWLYYFFSGQTASNSTEALTENQQDVSDHAFVRIDQSVEYSGYTVTLESGISDGKRLLLKYVITAPEGVILDGDSYSLEGRSSIASQNYSAYCQSGKFLDDGTPSDNSVSFLWEEIIMVPTEADFSISDDTKWQFHLDSIVEHRSSNGELTENILAEGSWDFSVTFSEDFLAIRSVELLEHPIRCSAKRSWRDKRFAIKVKVTSVELRPLSATICHRKPLTGDWEGVMLDPIYLVLKDGSRIEARFKMSVNRGSYTEDTCLFDRPISIDDIAYVDYPYAGKIAMPTSN